MWESGGQNGSSVTSNFLQSFARTLPPMLQIMKDVGGVELPDSLIKLGGEPLVDGKKPKDGAAAGEVAPIVPTASA